MTEIEKLPCEKIRLRMVCTCGKLDSDEKHSREDEAALIRKKAYDFLSTEKHPCTPENFLSRAVGNLYWSFSAQFECAVDQWFGAYAIVKKYIECEHGIRADKLEDEKVAAGMDRVQAGKEAHDESDCPDEPECFVYRWDPILRVTAECDQLEDGLAAIVVWFYENRKKPS